MGAPQPQFIPAAFAIAAAAPNRNVIPSAPVTTQRASFDLGFPPLTMTPRVAGGEPMLGPDMNGILYMMSSHTFYQQSGQPYRWSAGVAAAITGYAPGTVLGSTDGVTLWLNLVNGNMSDPDAGGAGWVAMYSYGFTTLAPSVGGTVVLTPAEASRPVIVVSGALAANLQIVLPNSFRRWLIVNTTSGGFTTTAKTAAGGGVQIPQGGFNGPTEVYGDTVNIYPVVAPITLPTDVAPTPNTIALRSNNGYLYATYFNQSSPLENFAINEVFAGAGDGFLRKINRANFAANFLLSQFAGQVANGQVPVGAVNQYRSTILNDSDLTGTPTAPTPAAGDSSFKVATTAFANPGVTVNANGICLRLPSGYKIQAGFTPNLGGGGTTLVTFPVAFTSSVFPVTSSTTVPTQSNAHNITLVNMQISNTGGVSYWIAVGI